MHAHKPKQTHTHTHAQIIIRTHAHTCTHAHTYTCKNVFHATHLLTCTLTYSLTLSLIPVYTSTIVIFLGTQQCVLLKSNTYFLLCSKPDCNNVVFWRRVMFRIMSGINYEGGTKDTVFLANTVSVQHVQLINKEVYDTCPAQRGDIIPSHSKRAFIPLPLKALPLSQGNGTTHYMRVLVRVPMCSKSLSLSLSLSLPHACLSSGRTGEPGA